MNLFTFLQIGESRFPLFSKLALFFLLFLLTVVTCEAQTSAGSRLSVVLLLDPSGGRQNTQDGVVAVFDDKFAASVGNEDSRKLANYNENLAINSNGTLLSIEGRPAVKSNDSLCLQMWKYRYPAYYLRLSGSNFPSSVRAVVRDKYLQEETSFDLSEVSIFPFHINSDSGSFSPARFTILFSQAAAGVMPVTLSNVKAYQKEKGIQIQWVAETETNIDNYQVESSANGQLFETIGIVPSRAQNSVSETYTWLDASGNAGFRYYRIKVIEKSGVIKFSPIIRVNAGSSNSELKVFPNPVKGKNMGLQLRNTHKGRYSLALYNSSGQKVYNGAIVHNGGSAAYTIVIEQQLNKGFYRLQLFNSNVTMNQTVMLE